MLTMITTFRTRKPQGDIHMARRAPQNRAKVTRGEISALFAEELGY